MDGVTSQDTKQAMDGINSTSVVKNSDGVTSQDTKQAMDGINSTSVLKDSDGVTSQDTKQAMDGINSTSVVKDSDGVTSQDTKQAMDGINSTSVVKDSDGVTSQDTKQAMDGINSTSVVKDSDGVTSQDTKQAMDGINSTSVVKDSDGVTSQDTKQAVDECRTPSREDGSQVVDYTSGKSTRKKKKMSCLEDYFPSQTNKVLAPTLDEEVTAPTQMKKSKGRRSSSKPGIITKKTARHIPKASTTVTKEPHLPPLEKLIAVCDKFGLERNKDGSGYIFKTLNSYPSDHFGSRNFFHVLAFALVDINHAMLIPTPLTLEDEFMESIGTDKKGKKMSDFSYSFDPNLYSVKPFATYDSSANPYDLDELLQWSSRKFSIDMKVYLEREEKVVTYSYFRRQDSIHIVIVPKEGEDTYFLRLRKIDNEAAKKAIDVDAEATMKDGLHIYEGSQEQLHPGLAFHEYNSFFDSSQDNELTVFLDDFEPTLTFLQLMKQSSFEEPAESLLYRITEVVTNKGDSNVVAIKTASTDRKGGHMRYTDLLTLTSDEAWLSNYTMDYYLNLMRMRFNTQERRITVFYCDFFETLFKKRSANLDTKMHEHYSHMNVYDYGRVQFGPAGISSCDVLICLINEPNVHWMVIIAELKKRKITLYDSLGDKKSLKSRPRDAKRNLYLNAFRIYLDDELRKSNGGGPLSPQPWHCHIYRPGRYGQTDTYNCGVYVLMYVECYLNGINLNEVKKNLLSLYRSYLLLTIVSNKTMYVN